MRDIKETFVEKDGTTNKKTAAGPGETGNDRKRHVQVRFNQWRGLAKDKIFTTDLDPQVGMEASTPRMKDGAQCLLITRVQLKNAQRLFRRNTNWLATIANTRQTSCTRRGKETRRGEKGDVDRKRGG